MSAVEQTTKLPAAATLEHSAALALTLPATVAAGSGVFRIDASDLRDFDSSTIALLMQARRLAHSAGRGFEAIGVPEQLAKLARLYGVDDLLLMAPSVPSTNALSTSAP